MYMCLYTNAYLHAWGQDWRGKSINWEVLITKINASSGQFAYSMDTTQEVIKALLAKFNITDNPEKFVLFEKIEGPGKIGNCILIQLSQWADIICVEDFNYCVFVIKWALTAGNR